MITRLELYKGEVKIDYHEEDGKHFYTHTVEGGYDGPKIDGVTSALDVIDKPGLMEWAVFHDMKELKAALLEAKNLTADSLDDMVNWASKAHDRVKDDAAAFGTTLHSWIENWIKDGTLPALPDGGQERIDEFLEWAKKDKVEFLESERVIYSKEFDYCGTLDVVVKIDGKTYVGDLKTSTALRPSHFFQTAAYEHALSEETGEKYAGRVIIRLGKKGLEVAFTDDLEHDFGAFRSALELSRNPRLIDEKIKRRKKQKWLYSSTSTRRSR